MVAFFGAAWLVVLGWRQGRNLFWRATVIGLCAVATWMPWIVRNSMAYHHLTGMGTQTGLAFWHGIVDQEWPYDARGESNYTQGLSPSERIRLDPYSAADACDADRRLRELAKIAIVHDPMLLPKSVLRNIGLFWSPVSRTFIRFGLRSRPLELLTGVYYILFFSFGALGLWRFRRTRSAWLVVFILVGTTLVHSVAFAIARYRMPFEPLLMIYVAGDIFSRFERRGRGDRQIVPPCIAASGSEQQK
jgi:hypothetical protein